MAWFAVWFFESHTILGAILILGGAWVAWILLVAVGRTLFDLGTPAVRAQLKDDPLAAVRAEAARQGGGMYLGQTRRGRWALTRPESSLLVLGPPRSGKTQGVIIPSLLCHVGAAVSTSTKPDVARATLGARSGLGEVWQFDPTGTAEERVGKQLRWSPVSSCGVWDDALVMARAMVQGSGAGVGTTDGSHWQKRAQALLASLLHAAAVGEREVGQVLQWVVRHDIEEPGMLLERRRGATQALALLAGLEQTEGRERSSIFSAASDALDAYASHGALESATSPNFWPERFVRSKDTIYIYAAGEQQAQVAPLVCGLLAELRRATYQAHAHGELQNVVLFALDELRNIAPFAELPQVASEGASQGLRLLAVLQDQSQGRERWGEAADGFLTLFQSKLILPGIADLKTLDAISTSLGEYDRQVVSKTRPGFSWLSNTQVPTTTTQTQRQRVLSPGEIAGLPHGFALHLDGVSWELLKLTRAHVDEPWCTLTQLKRDPR